MAFLGVTSKTIKRVSDSLVEFFDSTKHLFRTQTRDVSKYAKIELQGALLMENQRTYANISRKIVDPLDDGQNLQHFMSDSPWDHAPVFEHVREAILSTPSLSGGMLNIDESGDQCSSDNKAGGQKQYIGRLGKTETGQVAVVCSYYKDRIWTLTNGELFFPKSWFSAQKKKSWKKLHIPEDRQFKTKIEIAQDLITQCVSSGLEFECVGADTFYGRDSGFRHFVAELGKNYMCSVPHDTLVYLDKPTIGVPPKKGNGKGATPKNEQVVSSQKPVKVNTLPKEEDFTQIELRDCERGKLLYKHAFIPVWTVRKQTKTNQQNKKYTALIPVQELLVIRLEHTGKYSYSLTNAPLETPKQQLALWKSDRYFVERTIQDTKSQAGWDELRSAKYRAFMHRLAIDALAVWFVAMIKISEREHLVDQQNIKEQEPVPDISFANIRELLLVTFPLKTLNQEQAIKLVNKHLLNRRKSTKSRLEKIQT